jgi:chorismate mutase
MSNGSCCILQALSKRIHYGKFVAEAKFTQDPGKFEPHIKAQVQWWKFFTCIYEV